MHIFRCLRVLLLGLVIVLVAVPSAFAATGDAWTARTSAADNNWVAVTFGNGLFVAVALSGTGVLLAASRGTSWIAGSSHL